MRITALIALLICSPAAAQTPLITCGDLSGHSYYTGSSPLGPKGQGAWVQDSISPGRTVLIQVDAKTYDILSQHAAGYTSYSKDGCIIVKFDTLVERDDFRVMALCPYSTDVFTFSMNRDGTGKLLLSQAKVAPGITKSTTMVGNCRRE